VARARARGRLRRLARGPRTLLACVEDGLLEPKITADGLGRLSSEVASH